MTSNRFFCSGGVIRQCLRQHGWIGLLYLAGLLFTVPLSFFMSIGDEQPRVVLKSLFDSTNSGNELQKLILMTVPVLAGVMLLRFVQRQGPSDLYHSLPLRREHLLTSHLISGLILLLVPVWLTAGVTAWVNTSVELPYIFQINDVGSWALVVSVLTIFLFTFTVFVGICVGQSLLQTVVVYVLLLLPQFLFMMIGRFLERNLYGYVRVRETVVQYINGGEFRSNNNVWENLSPFVRIMDNLPQRAFSYMELLAYLGISLLFVALSYGLYRKRLVEKATQAIAFPFLQPLFKAGVILCAMLILGDYFNNAGTRGANWSIFGYALGAILGYIVVEMVIRKTWQIMRVRALVEMVVYGVIMGLVLYIPVSGWLGYEGRIPTAHSVEKVYVGREEPLGGDAEREAYYSQDRAYITSVLNLHRELVRAHAAGEKMLSKNLAVESAFIVYRLDDGSTMTRRYTFPEKPFRTELTKVMEAEPYKTVRYELDKLQGKAETINIESVDDNERRVVLTNPKETREFEDILREEVLSMSYSEMQSHRYPLGNVSITNKESSFTNNEPKWKRELSFNWPASYHKLTGWLEQKGYADKVVIDAKDIFSIRAVPIISQEMEPYQPNQYIEDYKIFRSIQQKHKAITIEDPKLWSTVLEKRRSNSYTPDMAKGTYLVQVKIKPLFSSDPHTRYYYFTPNDMTPELAKALPAVP
ncbi:MULTISPECIES: multidrug ABC transporter permease [Paenibacillus]|uniref:multidrug ABC transporter permease n=1 Tax=Paenibacillus TaxID=44249 RepID=UPI0005CE827D|nr:MULTISPECIES: multidrug ABC transporter permease [Paenibacillus]KAF6584778.1 multidrug ABC transporter permease [Paenibacillus sp. EKM211P]KJD39922.1 multidrug ABC transporter permease [Paenibacillus polymyxa]MDU8674774.1 multidrug ABC transporter permease [Paenibacillus polymyxa]MDU8699681.1 multidrug ABC transporter permease [Paenibacillus polymyxa]URJ54326.1 multidrug ABC transporter permease [Paenibacillus polymyxa]